MTMTALCCDDAAESEECRRSYVLIFSFFLQSILLVVHLLKCNMGSDVAFSFILRKHRYQGFQNKTSVMSLSLKSRVWTLRLLECWHFDRLLSCGITCTNDQCAKVARPRAFSKTSPSRQGQSRRKGLVQYCIGTITTTKMTRFCIVQPQQLHYNETAQQSSGGMKTTKMIGWTWQ